ncbi:MAG TPA: hypothetical protein DCP31_35885 [Cyanobacteria bacterium UBA8543]|nr:hypothetical protein [Cyanobacteria bacterium UBA8543]
MLFVVCCLLFVVCFLMGVFHVCKLLVTPSGLAVWGYTNSRRSTKRLVIESAQADLVFIAAIFNRQVLWQNWMLLS